MIESPIFASNVILLDASFLNQVIQPIYNRLTQQASNEFPKLDLVQWLSYLLMDAGLTGNDNEVQVILTHRHHEEPIFGCHPDHLSVLDGQACRFSQGEMAFSLVGTEGLTTPGELFIDLLRIIANSSKIERFLLVPSPGLNVSDMIQQLNETIVVNQRKQVFLCLLEAPSESLPFKWINVMYSLGYGFGIKNQDI